MTVPSNDNDLLRVGSITDILVGGVATRHSFDTIHPTLIVIYLFRNKCLSMSSHV
jgi:hypothetical protein